MSLPPNPPRIISTKEIHRFYKNTRQGLPGDCWEWAGYIHTDGVAMFTIGGQRYSAGRIALLLQSGVWVESFFQSCHHRYCFNPSHLNSIDIVRRSMNDPSSPDWKLKARMFYEAGLSFRAIGKLVGKHHQTVKKAVTHPTPQQQ